MPKIEVNEKLFFALAGEKLDYDTLEEKLTCAKAELDGIEEDAGEKIIKIELNDTNRPDLWSTSGVARALRIHRTAKTVDYMQCIAEKDYGKRIVHVDPALKDIRPFMCAFVVSGKKIDEPMLLDIIQTQEKLCWNFGRKRRSVSMGVYRSSLIEWPVEYKAVDPHKTSFIPLQCTQEMTCAQILKEHPKGKEYGWILADAAKYPLLVDAKNEVLSMAPIINSAGLGAVEVGDSDLLIELTGTDMASILLTANIVASDFIDNGYEILPCCVQHPYETGFGKNIVTPLYFQQKTSCLLEDANKLLGSNLTLAEAADALMRMGNTVETSPAAQTEQTLTILPPVYRNDFLHPVDVIEDIMMGKTLAHFSPDPPHDFTIGRLTDITLLSRHVKELLVGMGYQEMIFNYLGSQKDFVDNINFDSDAVIEIANPMSENYQFVRPSIIASLLASETVSGNAVYPHKIFEVGKIARIAESADTGTVTIHSVGFLSASANANLNDAASEVATLLYFLGHEYTVENSSDSRFISGRQANIVINGKNAGIFGEVNPAVLEKCSITMPCTACEIDVSCLAAKGKR